MLERINGYDSVDCLAVLSLVGPLPLSAPRVSIGGGENSGRPLLAGHSLPFPFDAHPTKETRGLLPFSAFSPPCFPENIFGKINVRLAAQFSTLALTRGSYQDEKWIAFSFHAPAL